MPAVAAINRDTFAYKDMVLGLMGVAIAGLTGLSTFFRWERTWKSRTLTEFAIDAYSAKWDLEVVHARLLSEDGERIQHICSATNELISNVTNVCVSESEGFFAGMQFPQAQQPR